MKGIDVALLDNTLYFGCRSGSKDFYYADEWQAGVREGNLALRVAHSRDQVRYGLAPTNIG